MEFEKMLKRLEEIVNQLESGECDFDEATKLFEEGKSLAEKCSEKLDSSKGKITVFLIRTATAVLFRRLFFLP